MALRVEQLANILHQMNPWWESGSVPAAMTGIPRPAPVVQAMEALDHRRVAIITGPRRSGKTTIMYQCAGALISSGLPAETVLFAMLDHPLLSSGESIGEIIEWFMAEFGHPRGRTLHLLLDEAHRAEGWGAWAKTLHDAYGARLVLSGSSALGLMAGSMESLTGRHETIPVRPLGFREFLDFRGAKPSSRDRHLMPKLADDYLTVGGFPEAVLAPEPATRRSMLLHLFEDILLGDIVGTYPIRDVRMLRDIAMLVLASTGTPLSFNKITRSIGCSVGTAEEYVKHMTACHLVTEVPFSSGSARERIRNPSKYYPIDTGMLDTLMGGAARGILAETAVSNALFSSPLGQVRRIGHWRDKREVDFVTGARPPEAYEVKYKDAVGEDELGGVRRLIERKRKVAVTVVTRSQSGTLEVGGTKVTMVPLWKFLLEAIGPDPPRHG